MNKRLGETSYKETAFGVLPRSKLIPLEIEGITRAWDCIFVYHQKAPLPITPQFLKEVHRVGFGWIFPDIGGKFRSVNVTVSDHEPPKFYTVPQYMEDFCGDLQERFRNLPSIDNQNFLHALIEFLSWAHHRFLWIHPFQDYNGRIGRLLLNMILLNMDLPPIELQVETPARRKKYVQALHAADHGEYVLLQKIVQEAMQEAALSL
ncbi:MAG: Fic family protein [Patescibacteria group bacterium]